MRIIRNYDDVKTFVDVGCGAGEMACDIVKRFGFNGLGVDFSESAINLAKDLRRDKGLKINPKFQLANASTIKKLDKVDLVTCFEVLEHVKNDDQLLRDIISLSNKYVIISVPAKKRLFSNSDVLAGHYRRYEKKELKMQLEANGLVVNKFISYGYPYTNLFRLLREFLAKRREASEMISMEKRSKKSGINILGDTKHPSIPGYNLLIKPLLWLSLPFNNFNLSEGYLVVCTKRCALGIK